MESKRLFIASSILAGAILFVQKAEATKCFAAKTTSEIISIFPIVISGLVESRTPISGASGNYKLKIKVDSVLKGQLKESVIGAIESHSGHAYASRHVYKVGQHYIFPVEQASDKRGYNALLPEDGCPELPEK